MARKGKEYSFALDTLDVPEGTAVDFYYALAKKGVPGAQTVNDGGKPFRAATVGGASAEGTVSAPKTTGAGPKKR